MNRRRLIYILPGLVMSSALAAAANDTATTPVLKKSKSDWKTLLPDDRYAVLFEEDTERPFSSPLNQEKRGGTFVCAACYLPLFDTAHKYDSGTGWPSFWDALPR